MPHIRPLKTMLMPLLLIAAAAACAQAFEIDEQQAKSYMQPRPPVIEQIEDSGIISSSETFTVSATLSGQKQKTLFCNKETSDCANSENWNFIDDMSFTPNPPEIISAKVFYYKNGDTSGTKFTDILKETDLGGGKWKWSATIYTSTLGEVSAGDKITYYLTVTDTRGNVTSQVPDTGETSSVCPASISGWSASILATPATANCTLMTSHSICDAPATGAPASCSSAYTANDTRNDVCGWPDESGKQQIVSDPKTDILGFSAAADKDYICANIGLGAPPPNPTDTPPIEGYLLFIMNPDIDDNDPDDMWIKNGYTMSFTPEVIGTSELTRMLWETDCLTSPDTANTMECRLLSPIGANSKLQIGYNSGLNFIAKGSGTGVIHQDTYNLIGTTSKTTYMYAMTAEINLSGGTPFWVSDVSPAMGFMQTNQKITVSAAAVPPGCTSSSSCAVISNCADYTSAAGCSPLTQVDPLTRDPHTNAFAATPKSGVEALLMSQDGSFIGGPATTDANGNFSLVIDTSTTPITTEGKYKIMLRIPAAQKTGMPCTSGNDSPAGDCLILLKETIISGDSTVNKVAMPALPMAGGGKAEVGNANCDTAINMKDFNVLKAAFNSNSGDANYKTYADFNGDGVVNMKDFNILKANFGKTFSADTSGGDPALSFLCQ